MSLPPYIEAVGILGQQLGEDAGGDGGVLHGLEHVGQGVRHSIDAVGEALLGLRETARGGGADGCSWDE